MNERIPIVLDRKIMNSLSLHELDKYYKNVISGEYFIKSAGPYNNSQGEHYRLLAYLSMLIDSHTVVDIGTYTGLSALALSYNENNRIITYDIEDCFTKYSPNIITPKNKKNIEFRIGDCRKDVDLFKNTNFVVLDVDPHDGKQEVEFFKFFEEINYEGIVVLDDIYINYDMEEFWKNIKQEKHDVMRYGHWSGTGIVQFGNKFNIILN